MKPFDFENPPLTSVEIAKTFKVEELGGQCQKISGVWICAAYVDRGDVRTIVAISQGKKAKPVLRECMTNAVNRITEFNGGVE